jgi:acetoin utilization deacetylase AcuC-like enzyme
MLTLISSVRFGDHLPPVGHPERAERAEVMQRVAKRFAASDGAVVEPPMAADEHLLRVHQRRYLDLIAARRGRPAKLDEDTYMSPDSDDVARFAAGAAIEAVDLVLGGGPGSRAIALVRPPGHHAEADRAMGFCLYNNIAIGAASARARGASRVAIVDFDVHHGNGTQHTFYEDPTVLFVSSHQYPFWPGTGSADEIGRGAGLGFTLNLPLAAGATDADVLRRYESQAVPALRAFAPELLMVSAGFDAHERDPLGGCSMTTPGFRKLIALLLGVAGEVCDGRAVFVTEGGYDLSVLDDGLETLVDLCRAAV